MVKGCAGRKFITVNAPTPQTEAAARFCFWELPTQSGCAALAGPHCRNRAVVSARKAIIVWSLWICAWVLLSAVDSRLRHPGQVRGGLLSRRKFLRDATGVAFAVSGAGPAWAAPTPAQRSGFLIHRGYYLC